jgi:hypothetical protein
MGLLGFDVYKTNKCVEMKMFGWLVGDGKNKSTDISEQFRILNVKIDAILQTLQNARISKTTISNEKGVGGSRVTMEVGSRVVGSGNGNNNNNINQVNPGKPPQQQIKRTVEWYKESPTADENSRWREYQRTMNLAGFPNYTEAINTGYSERFARESVGFNA